MFTVNQAPFVLYGPGASCLMIDGMNMELKLSESFPEKTANFKKKFKWTAKTLFGKA